MLTSRDFKIIAKKNLKGRWMPSIILCILGGLLGASMDVAYSVDLFTKTGGTGEYTEVINQLKEANIYDMVLPFLIGLGITLIVISLIQFVIGGAVTLGYAQYFLNLTDEREATVGTLFSNFRRLWEGFCMQFFRGMMVMLWSILFVFPGYIALYRYAMTPYIMAENHDLSVMEAITESKRIMKGNKWRLFCLDVSFLGWYLVGTVTLGIGFFWITPYVEASRAAFYREITEQRYSNPVVDSHPINEDVLPEESSYNEDAQPEEAPYEEIEIPQSSEDEEI